MSLYKKGIKILFLFLVLVLTVLIINFLLQKFYAHRNTPFVPTYEKLELTEETDYETIFLQTGLGEKAVNKLKFESRFNEVIKAQEIFFNNPDTECVPMFGWFTREDRLGDDISTPFYDLQEGDIIITLSTHSAGWRHGHAGIIVDEYTVLECQQLGSESSLESIYYWKNYTNYAVLRIKDIKPKEQETMINYTLENLRGIPYNLFSGLLGDKAPNINNKNFGLYCTNLIWYAWNNFGFDLDSDGGKIVSAYDILHSDKLEVIQLYGIDPRDFIRKKRMLTKQ